VPNYVAPRAFCECTTSVTSLALVVSVSFPVRVEGFGEAVACHDVSRGRVGCVFVSFGGLCVFMCRLCLCEGTYLYPRSLCRSSGPGGGGGRGGGGGGASGAGAPELPWCFVCVCLVRLVCLFFSDVGV